MKPQTRPFTVEIKHSRRNQKSAVQSIWSDVDLSAYQSSEIDREIAPSKPEIPATSVTEKDCDHDQRYDE